MIRYFFRKYNAFKRCSFVFPFECHIIGWKWAYTNFKSSRSIWESNEMTGYAMGVLNILSSRINSGIIATILEALSSSAFKSVRYFANLSLGALNHRLMLWSLELKDDIEKGSVISDSSLLTSTHKGYYLIALKHYNKALKLKKDMRLVDYCKLHLSLDYQTSQMFNEAQSLNNKFARRYKFDLLESQEAWTLKKIGTPQSSKHIAKQHKSLQKGYVIIYKKGIIKKTSFKLHYPSRDIILANSVNVTGLNGSGLIIDDEYFSSNTTCYQDNYRSKLFNPYILGVYSDYIAIKHYNKILFSIDNSLILTGSAWNYFHYIFDVMGSLMLVENSLQSNIKNKTFIIFNDSSYLKNWQLEILSLLGFQENQCFIISKSQLVANKYAPCFNKSTYVEYPNWNNIINPKIVRLLRKKLNIEGIKINKNKKVFLCRGKKFSRAISNSEQAELISLFKSYGFKVIFPEQLSVKKQMDAVSDASIIAADAGAGAANFLFAPKGCKLLLLATDFGARHSFSTLAKEIGAELHIVLSEIKSIEPLPLALWSTFTPKSSFTDIKNALDIILN